MIMECVMLNIIKTCPWDEGVVPYTQYPLHHAYQTAGEIYEHLLQHITTYYLLIQWSRVLLEKLTGFQLIKKFPTFYGTQRFTTAVTSVHHLSLFSASSNQSIPPHPTS